MATVVATAHPMVATTAIPPDSGVPQGLRYTVPIEFGRQVHAERIWVNRAGSNEHSLRQTGVVAVIALMGTAFLTALAPAESRGLVAYACVPIVIVVGIVLRMIKVGDTISASPVLGFIPWLAVTWPVTMIYFAMVSPDATYVTMFGTVPFLLRADVVLTAVLVFLCGYCVGLSPVLLGHRKAELAPAEQGKFDAGWWLAAIGSIAMMLACAISAVGIQGRILFVANGLRNYLTGLVFSAGYRWKSLSRGRRLFITVALVATGVVNTIANARGLAVLPFLFVLGGYLISPATTRRARVILVAGALSAIPVYIVVGNQTRIVLGSVGYEDFDQRANVLTDALSGNIAYEGGEILG